VTTKVKLTYAKSTPLFDHRYTDQTAVFSFTEEGFGFGQFYIKRVGNQHFLDAESMSPEKIKEYFSQLVDSCITDEETDPDKFLVYCNAFGCKSQLYYQYLAAHIDPEDVVGFAYFLKEAAEFIGFDTAPGFWDLAARIHLLSQINRGEW
jgi:hypothetical protein